MRKGKVFLAFALLLGAMALHAQEHELFSSAYSEKRWVYEVHASCAHSASYSQTRFLDTAQAIDSMHISENISEYLTTLDHGHYVFVTLYRDHWLFDYYQKSPYYIEEIKDGNRLAFRIYDQQQSEVKNIATVIDKKVALYDYQEEAYVFDKVTGYDVLKIVDRKDSFFYRVETSDWYKDTKKRRRPSSGSLGLMVLSKPKYRHGDTLKLAIYAEKRNGKPRTEPLALHLATTDYAYWYSSRNRRTIAKIHPTKPGLYLYEMVIADTMTLDKKYYLEVGNDKHWDSWDMEASFYLEDYLLDESTFELEVINSTSSTNEDLEIVVTSKDANGNGLSGARVNLNLSFYSIESLKDSNDYLPLEIHDQSYELSPTGSTDITIDAGTFPKGEMTLQMSADFLNASNERQGGTFYYIHRKEQVTEEERHVKDSLFRVIDNVDHFRLKALQPIFTGRKCLAKWHNSNGVLHEKRLTTTSKLEYIQGAASITLYLDEPFEHNGIQYERFAILLDEFAPLVFLNTSRDADSSTFHLVNNRGLRVNYQIYEGFKLIETGTTSESQSWRLQTKDHCAHTMRVEYEWAGRSRYITKEAVLNTYQLKVQLEAPEKTFPGETEEIKLSVQDYEGKPVADADVIATGINDNFRSYSPEFNQYHSKWIGRNFTHLSLDEESKYQTARKATRDEIKGLADMKDASYYSLLFPDSNYAVFANIKSGYTSFQLHPMVAGVEQTVRVVYVDDVPVYINGVSSQANILLDDKEHTIRVRLSESEVTLHKVRLQKGFSNEIVFDPTQGGSYISVEKRKYKLKRKERKYLNQYLLNIHSKTRGLIWSGQHYWRVSEYGTKIIGPVEPGSPLHFEFEDRTVVDQTFEVLTSDSFWLTPVKLKRWQTLDRNYRYGSPEPRHFCNQYVPVDDLRKKTETSGNKYYPSVYSGQGGAFLVDLPEEGIWRYELTRLNSDSAYASGTYAGNAYGLQSHIGIGDYAFKLTSTDKEYIYSFSIKEENLFHISRANASEHLLSVRTIKHTDKASIEGHLVDIRLGASTSETLTLSSDGRSTIYLTEQLVNGRYRFSGKVPAPGIYYCSYTRYHSKDVLQRLSLGPGKEFNDLLLVFASNDDQYAYLYGMSGIKQKSMTLYRHEQGDAALYFDGIPAEFGDYAAEEMPAMDMQLRGKRGSKPPPPDAYTGSLLLADFNGNSMDSVGFDKGTYTVDLRGIDIRDNFSDVALWKPNLSTDINGLLKFKATFPDDITQWNTYYFVFGDGKANSFAKAEIKSFLPLSANLRAPRFLIDGDETHLSLQTLNYTGASLSIRHQVLMDEESLFEANEEIDKSLETEQVVKVEGTDSVSFTYLVGSTNGFNDGEKRTIPVFPIGLEESTGHFRSVKDAGTFNLQFDPELGPITIYVSRSPLPSLLWSLNKLRKYPHGCNEQIASKLIALLAQETMNKAQGQVGGNGLAIRKMINKLRKNQNEFGAWSWFGKKGETSPWVSLHVATALGKARQAGYTFSINPIGFEIFIKQQKRSEDQLKWLLACKTLQPEVTLTPYLNAIDYHKLSDFGKVLYLSIHANGEESYSQLVKLKKRTATGAHYYGNDKSVFYENNIATTCLAFDLMKEMGKTEELENLALYLLYSKRNGDWSNTLHKAMILERLIPYYFESEKAKKDVSEMYIYDAEGNKTVIKGEITVAVAANIKFEKTGNTPLFFSAHQQSFNPEPILKNSMADIAISFEEDGQKTDSLVAGQALKMICTVNVKEKSEYCTVTIPVPAGCDYGEKTQGNYFSGEVHREYFKDRVVIYFERLSPGQHEFSINLEPRYSGTYTLNPSQMELMYFPTLSANNLISRISIY